MPRFNPKPYVDRFEACSEDAQKARAVLAGAVKTGQQPVIGAALVAVRRADNRVLCAFGVLLQASRAAVLAGESDGNMNDFEPAED